MVPGRKAVEDAVGHRHRPEGDPRRRPGAGRGRGRRAAARPERQDRLRRPRRRPSSPSSRRGSRPTAASFLDLDWTGARPCAWRALAYSNPTRLVWEAAAAVAFTAFCAAATVPNADRARPRPATGHGPPGHRPARLQGLLLRPPPRPRAHDARGTCRDASGSTSASSGRASAARSRPGGWPSSTGPRARSRASSCSSAGCARATPTSASRWTSTTSRDIYGLIQGQGAQVVVANLVGGGSNLYLAASLRAPSEIFERTRPSAGRRAATGACGRSRSAAARLEPLLRAAPRPGCASRRPPGSMVSKSGGVWAAMLREAGYTCDRVPLAISHERCVNAKWCYTGCVFGAKNSLITNYLASAERRRGRGAAAGPGEPGPAVERAALPLHRPGRTGSTPRPRARPERSTDIECKVLILAAGAMGTPPILMRSQPEPPASLSQPGRQAPRRERRPRRGDRGQPEARCATCSACPATASSTRAARSRR